MGGGEYPEGQRKKEYDSLNYLRCRDSNYFHNMYDPVSIMIMNSIK